MAWLHTWAGLSLGSLLYFVFLTGTAGYFDTEIDYWMRPEIDRTKVELTTARAITLAQQRVESQAPRAERWILYPPSGRDVPEISVFWRTLPDAASKVVSRSEVLDRSTGLPVEARATGGGAVLYQMHYLLRYMSSTAAYWTVGVATMLMLVAIVSGVITHKRIFRDFFTFRPRKGQRSWLDAHNVLSVLALPFHLMITYSGLIFFCFTYMPFVVAATYGAGTANRDVFFDAVFQRGGADPERAGIATPLASLTQMAGEAERRWGVGQIRSIDVRNPGDTNARVTFTRSHVTPTSNGDRLTFDGASGMALETATMPRSGPMLVNDTMMSLHEGLFAGPVLRWLYFLAGVVGTAMIGTGLIRWTAKRRREGATHLGLVLVERLNVGTIAGLPAAIAVYFWANRLLPVDLAGRAAWEVHALFLAWAALLLYPLVRPLRRAWIDEFRLAAALCGLLPVLNWLTTSRHLGNTLPAGDWVLAGFDLTLLAFGVAFALIAERLARLGPATDESLARRRAAAAPASEEATA